MISFIVGLLVGALLAWNLIPQPTVLENLINKLKGK